MDSISQERWGQAPLAPGPNQVREVPASGNGQGTLPESALDEETAHPEKASSAQKVRKRTKTGCLTCRKRRIKCGEERPTCKNCTKSKRDCEGYVPRVVFKDPVNAFRQNLDILQEHHLYGSQMDPNAAGFGNLTSVTADGVPLAPLAPRPSYDELGLSHASRMGDPYAVVGPDMQNHLNISMFGMPTGHAGHINARSNHSIALPPNDRRASIATPSSASPSEVWPGQYGDISSGNSNVWPRTTASSTTPISPYPTPLTANSVNGAFPTSTWPVVTDPNNNGREGRANSFSGPFGQRRSSIAGDASSQEYFNHQIQFQNQLYGLPPATPLQPTFQETEEDAFDIDSEEEENAEIDQVGDVQSSDLGLMLQMSACRSDVDTRTIANTPTTPNILATYRPAYTASPLMDSHTARVFCHFITATGPTLNVCERHPANPAIIFSGRPVPHSQRALWSYTLPMLALRHQGLLHSMLALSSLHIAKLQQTSPTPSLKHYHFALRRVAKALGSPARRCDVATLAATLLLGFYEVTTAEHNKWNSHLSGARELIAEIDFSGMTKRLELERAREEETDAGGSSYVFNGHTNFFSKPVYYETPGKAARKVDKNLIAILTGHNTGSHDDGQIGSSDGAKMMPTPNESVTAKEMETFQVQCDLFWWYAKQDVYQSILSNNRLLLSFDRWGQCLPRSAIGRQDASYGTMDHLLLLLARLADFAAKDLPRKRRAGIAAAKAQAAQAEARKSDSGPSPTTKKKGQSPPFYGMMPDPGPVRLPSGFDQNQHDRIFSAPPPSENKELSAATAEAETEHAAITAAFDAWAEALGPSFAPLSSEHMTPMATPFGPAIYYRSYPIACIQALFHCAHIIRIRASPSMPAAAMAAAGVAAQTTAPYANTIGRICAGIQPVSNTAPLNPHHGAALMDICMPLFHAGVQYRDPAQRGWTITKLRDVSRLTGWQTSALIASGCERAWIRAADMGRGPPYERTMNSAAKDDRVAGRSRDPRFLAHPPRNNNDRRFVRQNPGTRVYWAMGILSVEEDMAEMSLNEGEME